MEAKWCGECPVTMGTDCPTFGQTGMGRPFMRRSFRTQGEYSFGSSTSRLSNTETSSMARQSMMSTSTLEAYEVMYERLNEWKRNWFSRFAQAATHLQKELEVAQHWGGLDRGGLVCAYSGVYTPEHTITLIRRVDAGTIDWRARRFGIRSSMISIGRSSPTAWCISPRSMSVCFQSRI